MPTRKKVIFIYYNPPSGILFYKKFFSLNRTLQHEYFSDIRILKKRVKENPPSLIIFDTLEHLPRLNSLRVNTPVIAMVPVDAPKSLRDAAAKYFGCSYLSLREDTGLGKKIETVLGTENDINELSREKKDLEAILELSAMVTSTLNPKEVLYAVVRKISDLIEVTRCSIISLGFKGKHSPHVISSYEDPDMGYIKLDIEKYPEIKKVLATKKPLVINNAQEDVLLRPVRKFIQTIGIRAIMVIPVIFRDEVIGTLFLRTSRSYASFTEREVRLCKTIANVSSNALFNAFTFERLRTEKNHLEAIAVTDYLTDVYNVRYLYHRLEEEISRAKRYRSSISCIMMDIDYFKKINDTYGHKIGDSILHEFAQLIKKHIRKSDIFARYGGEEFILILPNATSEGTLQEAERLMEIVRSFKFAGLKKGALTVSMGIAHYPDRRISSHEDLITLADDALFEAKNRGRNTLAVNHQHLAYSGS